jgi:ATP-dependent Lon protease
VRSHAEELGATAEFFAKSDIHIHVPAGAMPKDGPSAGVAMVTALSSLMTNRPVRSDTAMTGEISLRGNVLPIGGIKQKVLGARRAGIKRIILPAQNEFDLEEVPAEVRKGMQFILVRTIDEVLEKAFRPTRSRRKSKSSRKKKISSRRSTSPASGRPRQKRAARSRT